MTTYIHSDTRIAQGDTLSVTDSPYDEHLGSSAVIAYEDQGDGSTVFANAGTIEGIWETLGGGNLDGIVISRYSGVGDGLVHNEATGVLQVSSYGEPDPDFGWLFFARGYYAPQQAVDILNEGVIEVYSQNSSAIAIEMWGIFGNTVTNRGDIVVTSAFDAYGIKMVNSDRVINSGRIEVYGSEIATGVDIGHYGGEGFENSGSIVVRSDPSSPWATVGLAFFSAGEPGLWMPNVILNSGTIDAEIAILANDGNGLASTLATREVLHNSGSLLGDVFLAYGDDTIVNAGIITGVVDLGQGADFFDGRRGRQDSAVLGGTGDDVLIGGNRDDFLLGGPGADQISGGSGNDYIIDDRGGDGIDGGSGYDVLSYAGSSRGIVANLALGTVNSAERDLVRHIEDIVGSRFADAITGSLASEALEGGAGHDTLGGGAGADTLYGGLGNDRLGGGAGSDRLLFSAGDGVDTVTDFAPGADRLDIYGYAGYQRLVQLGDDTLVVLSANDRILLQGVDAATLAVADFLFDAGSRLSPSAAPGDRVLVINEDLVVRAGERLEFNDPFPVLVSDQYFENTGVVMQQFLALPSVFNDGLIAVSASVSDATAHGIVGSLLDGPAFGERLVVNTENGVLRVAAAGGGAALGVTRFEGLWNHGRIEVGSTRNDATGIAGGGLQAEIVNSGDIVVSAGVSGFGIVATNAVWNSGSVEVGSSERGVGIDLYASRTDDQLVNSGSVSVSDNTAALDSVALYLSNLVRDYAAGGNYANLNVWNSGSIRADHAILAYSRVEPEPVVGFNVYNSGVIAGRVTLGNGADLLVNSGSIAGDVMLAAGNDRFDGRNGTLDGALLGQDGKDVLLAGAGANRLSGGRGDDTLSGGAGADELSGGAGNDVFHVSPGFGADVISDFTAGGSLDRIHVRGYSEIRSIEQLGEDTLLRFSATDSILLLGVRATELSAADFRFGAPALAPVALIPAAPQAAATPQTPADPGVSTIALVGSGGGDTLQGGAAADLVYGLDGADVIYGNAGHDSLMGNAGTDRLAGGTGNDTLSGDAGRDSLGGGEGADVFRFDDLDFAALTLGGSDLITDFSRAQGDRIDLSAVDAARRSPGDDPFRFIGDSAFGGNDGELRQASIAGYTVLMGDIDGDSVADFWITLNGLHPLTANDFLL